MRWEKQGYFYRKRGWQIAEWAFIAYRIKKQRLSDSNLDAFQMFHVKHTDCFDLHLKGLLLLQGGHRRRSRGRKERK